MTAGRQHGRTAGLFVLALMAAMPLAAQEDLGIARGSVPQAVSIEDLDGAAVDLGQWIGQKPALFEFWATWCPNCAALEPRMIQWQREYGDRVQFVAVAVGVNERPASIRRHLERRPLPYPVLWDGRGRATRAFSAPATSYIVILDADGKVVYTGLGAEQDLSAALAGVAGGR